MIIDTLFFNNYPNSNSNAALNPFTFGIIGALLTILGAIWNDRHKRLLKKGIKVEGVVFSVEVTVSGSSLTKTYYPVIRYLTLQNEWITKRYNIGSKPSLYKEGDKVIVIYDPTDTSVFTLNDTISKIAPIIFILIGVALLIGAIIIYIIK